MKIGLQVASFKWPDGSANIGAQLAEVACTADDAGFDSLWVMDHFFQVERTLSGLTYTEPAMKYTDPMLDSYTAQIAQQMWAGGVEPYQDKHYRLLEPLNGPRPLSKPHSPILIGGSGEKKTLRLVAQYADACNLFVNPDHAELSRKLDVLKRYCDECGRPYEAIERTILGGVKLGPGAMSTADVLRLCQGLARIGFQHYIFNMRNDYEIEAIEAIGREVMPEVRGL